MKIKGIATAQPGWVARFKSSDGTFFEAPVAVWAIIENDGHQIVSGFSEAEGGWGDNADTDAESFEGWFLKT